MPSGAENKEKEHLQCWRGKNKFELSMSNLYVHEDFMFSSLI